jgi:hypothetical protein
MLRLAQTSCAIGIFVDCILIVRSRTQFYFIDFDVAKSLEWRCQGVPASMGSGISRVTAAEIALKGASPRQKTTATES